MDLDRMAAVLRPRSSWEAADLGLAMARRWWRPLWAGWAAVMAPVYLLVWALLIDHPWLAWGLLWWLRPALDRVPLHVLSRAMFGATPGALDVLRSLPTMMRPGLFGDLTFRRLEPARSFKLAVAQLERLTGRARAQRSRSLTRGAGSVGATLTACFLGVQLLTWLNLQVLVFMLLPSAPGDMGADALRDWFIGGGDQTLRVLGFVVADALAVFVVEPLYVAAGFATYLSRRTDLEGWDVELAFRRLAARTRGLGAAVAVLAALLLAPAPARADAPPREPGEVAAEVLARPAFETRRTEARWEPKVDLDWELPRCEAEEPQRGCERGESVGSGAAQGLQVALWILLLAFVVVLAWLLARERHRLFAGAADRPPPPTSRFGVDIRPESLPPDVAAEAMALWNQGRIDQALSLLYRGALSFLVNRRGMVIEDGATESDCVSLARDQLAPAAAGYFGELTRDWQRAAYGHLLPAAERGPDLCMGFREHFGEAP